MELHNTSLCYAFLYQNIEFHITKILKEIIAKKTRFYKLGNIFYILFTSRALLDLLAWHTRKNSFY